MKKKIAAESCKSSRVPRMVQRRIFWEEALDMDIHPPCSAPGLHFSPVPEHTAICGSHSPGPHLLNTNLLSGSVRSIRGQDGEKDIVPTVQPQTSVSVSGTTVITPSGLKVQTPGSHSRTTKSESLEAILTHTLFVWQTNCFLNRAPYTAWGAAGRVHRTQHGAPPEESGGSWATA